MRQRRAEDKEEEAELTQPVLTGGLRARTVSKPRESLQDGCGPLVRHNYRHTHTQPCVLRMETLGGAGTEAVRATGGQEEAGNVTLCLR